MDKRLIFNWLYIYFEEHFCAGEWKLSKEGKQITLILQSLQGYQTTTHGLSGSKSVRSN